eukprot:CAMPEP_0195072332 /NCGR_PEP_ID=MMETSP0448-20130528/15946_1 /TAXON_ID=66468 /ORGANISM="Heterocapsa triquestra, Strain CCMP 448" /LENGTH=32 /DNA_ID= /DNA_START= /DNA_END= /DNA_ORIENTATION=
MLSAKRKDAGSQADLTAADDRRNFSEAAARTA